MKLMRVTKNLANQLNHAKCILKLNFNKFQWHEEDLINFHKTKIEKLFARLQSERQQELIEIQNNQQNKSKKSKSST